MKFLVSESQFKKVISKIQSDMEFYLLNEGINEDRALRMLKDRKIENAEEILNFLKNKDKSKNHKLLPALTLFYANARNNEEFGDVIKTFDKIFKQKTIPDIIVDGNTVKVLGNEYYENYFDGFKEFIEHYYYEKDVKEEEEEKKLYDTNANKIFENENFEVYYAASEQVCIKLFGRDNEGRIFVKRGYCIGWQKGTGEPETYYSNYRDPSGSHRRTFYVVVDKKLYQNYLKTNEDNPSLINVVGVKDDFAQTGAFKFFVWDRNNPGEGDRVEGYSSVEEYMKHLSDGGVNLNIFKPMPYQTKSTDAIRKIRSNPNNDSLFMSLTPQQKDTYVSNFATYLTPLQMKFMLNKMPIGSIQNFVNNYETIGDLDTDSFGLLSQNLQKSFLRSKLKQLVNGSENFNFNSFFNYMTNKININYSIEFIKDSFTNEVNPNKNIEESRKVLGLLSPKEFFESLIGENHVKINNQNFKTNSLPTNLGDYIGEATHLEIEELSKINDIPDSIGSAKNLKHLEIKRCVNLTSLPESIGELTQLEFLGLQNNNNLTSIPESIGNLTNLDHLAIQENNMIVELPSTIGNLRNLMVINLEGTPLRSLPIEELKKLPDLLHITHDEVTLENLSVEEKEFLENF
jgi:hypothetical protein